MSQTTLSTKARQMSSDSVKAPPILPGVLLIETERRRQIESEGWSAEHDDEHADGQMAMAAALYATPVLLYQKVDRANCISFVDPWPWDDRWDKRPEDGNVIQPNGSEATTERVRQLVKAGALIAAEIDRLLRTVAEELTGGDK
jgi:hypothetical protein